MMILTTYLPAIIMLEWCDGNAMQVGSTFSKMT